MVQNADRVWYFDEELKEKPELCPEPIPSSRIARRRWRLSRERGGIWASG